MDQDTLNRAATHLHGAATDATRWPQFLDVFCTATKATGASLFYPNPDQRGGVLATMGNMVGQEDDYFCRWIHLDPWNQSEHAATLFKAAGDVRFGSEFISDAAFKRTEYYDGLARHTDSGHKLFLKVCDGNDPYSSAVHLALSRSFKQAPFDEQDKTALRWLWPKLRQAAQDSWTLRVVSRRAHLIEGAIDQDPSPTWIVRACGHIDFANRAALSLMAHAPWIGTRHGKLVRFGTLDQAALLGPLLHRRPDAYPDALQTSVGQGEQVRSVRIQANSIEHAPLYRALWPQATGLLRLHMERSEDDGIAYRLQQVIQVYDLSVALGEVLGQLVLGQTPQQIAAIRQVKIGTIRSQIAELRARMGTSRTTDLVRLVLISG